MGLFDVSIAEELKSQQEVKKLQVALRAQLKAQSFEEETIDEEKLIKNYKTDNALLKYDIRFIEDKNFLIIEGELKQVILLTVLILFSILFTYGMGVILIVAFTYYQRVVTTKALKTLINKIKSTENA